MLPLSAVPVHEDTKPYSFSANPPEIPLCFPPVHCHPLRGAGCERGDESGEHCAVGFGFDQVDRADHSHSESEVVEHKRPRYRGRFVSLYVRRQVQPLVRRKPSCWQVLIVEKLTFSDGRLFSKELHIQQSEAVLRQHLGGQQNRPLHR